MEDPFLCGVRYGLTEKHTASTRISKKTKRYEQKFIFKLTMHLSRNRENTMAECKQTVREFFLESVNTLIIGLHVSTQVSFKQPSY